MGKLRVYCLKTLNKLLIYPLSNTPSAPSENIKDEERTHQSQPTDTPLPPQTVVKTPSQSKDGECQCIPCKCRISDQNNPQWQARAAQCINCYKERKEHILLMRTHVPSCGEILRKGPPSIEDRKTSIVVASHLTEVPPNMLPPGQHSYIGYDIVVLTQTNTPQPSVQRGDIYIHLYDSGCRQRSVYPMMPPDDEEASHIHLSILKTSEDFLIRYRIKPSTPPINIPPRRLSVQLDPEAKPFRLEGVFDAERIKDPLMTREAAEALTSFRKEVRFNEPVPEVKEVKRERDEGELVTQLSLKSVTDIHWGQRGCYPGGKLRVY